MNLTIGLFGTCGNSTWRQDFIDVYEMRKMKYYNPQVDDWKPEDAEIEAEHLATDQIILFPVLAETYGLGSLGEVGFSIAQAMRYDNRRDFVILIDQKPLDELEEKDPALYKESVRMRALQKQHLAQWKHMTNVFVVDNLNDMLEASIKLYECNRIRQELKDGR